MLRRFLQIVGSLFVAVAASGGLYLLATSPRTSAPSLDEQGVYSLAIIALFSLALVAIFRTIEGSFVWPWGKDTFRAGGVTVLLWLLCFGVGVVALTLVKAVDKLPTPLWQHRPPLQAQALAPRTGPAAAVAPPQVQTNP